MKVVFYDNISFWPYHMQFWSVSLQNGLKMFVFLRSITWGTGLLHNRLRPVHRTDFFNSEKHATATGGPVLIGPVQSGSGHFSGPIDRTFEHYLLFIPLLFSYMCSRATLTRLRLFASSIRARFFRWVISHCIPILAVRSNGIRHWGQEQRPRFRIPAMMTCKKC